MQYCMHVKICMQYCMHGCMQLHAACSTACRFYTVHAVLHASTACYCMPACSTACTGMQYCMLHAVLHAGQHAVTACRSACSTACRVACGCMQYGIESADLRVSDCESQNKWPAKYRPCLRLRILTFRGYVITQQRSFITFCLARLTTGYNTIGRFLNVPIS